jgi:hypothetical protein
VSVVPGAIDGLLAVFAAALPGVQVVDGPPTADIRGDVLGVGLAPQEPSDVESTNTDADLGAGSREQFVVVCVARSWSGNNALKAQRDRTFRMVDAAEAALAANPSLGGAVSRARWAGASYQPWRTEQAQLVVDVIFRVDVTQL